jgi:hypothetical protein
MVLDSYDLKSELRANNPNKRAASEANAVKLGFAKLSRRRKVFELTPTDQARGRALDRRVRAQLLGY